MNENNTIWEQLKALRTVTENTGVVHEAQVYQLKFWGNLTLQHVKHVEVALIPEVFSDEDALLLGQPPCVEVRGTEVNAEPHEQFNEILDGLDRSVKSLLGRHWKTRVLVDGEVIFEGQGRPRAKKDLARTIQRLKDADAAAKQGASDK
jgi:hypothetical protein